MSSIARTVTDVPRRLLARPAGRHDDYVFCTRDEYWFRPPYTDGKCPLCGDVAPGGGPPMPMFARVDRFVLGMGMLMLVSIGMTVLVLFMYFKA